MNPVVKNIIAIVVGIVIGGIVNMGIVMISGSVVPLPEGVDPSSMESIKANMHLYEAKHFIMPFLAHAIGTLVGAIIAYKIAATHRSKMALSIGFFFLLGGIMNVMMLPSPLWFNTLDLLVAYIPMALIGAKLAQK